jgi:hypothetical protein
VEALVDEADAARLLILVTTVAIGGTAGMAAKGAHCPVSPWPARRRKASSLGVSLATPASTPVGLPMPD